MVISPSVSDGLQWLDWQWNQSAFVRQDQAIVMSPHDKDPGTPELLAMCHDPKQVNCKKILASHRRKSEESGPHSGSLPNDACAPSVKARRKSDTWHLCVRGPSCFTCGKYSLPQFYDRDFTTLSLFERIVCTSYRGYRQFVNYRVGWSIYRSNGFASFGAEEKTDKKVQASTRAVPAGRCPDLMDSRDSKRSAVEQDRTIFSQADRFFFQEAVQISLL